MCKVGRIERTFNSGGISCSCDIMFASISSSSSQVRGSDCLAFLFLLLGKLGSLEQHGQSAFSPDCTNSPSCAYFVTGLLCGLFAEVPGSHLTASLAGNAGHQVIEPFHTLATTIYPTITIVYSSQDLGVSTRTTDTPKLLSIFDRLIAMSNCLGEQPRDQVVSKAI